MQLQLRPRQREAHGEMSSSSSSTSTGPAAPTRTWTCAKSARAACASSFSVLSLPLASIAAGFCSIRARSSASPKGRLATKTLSTHTSSCRQLRGSRGGRKGGALAGGTLSRSSLLGPGSAGMTGRSRNAAAWRRVTATAVDRPCQQLRSLPRAPPPDEVGVLLQQLPFEQQESEPACLERLRLRHGGCLLHTPEKVLEWGNGPRQQGLTSAVGLWALNAQAQGQASVCGPHIPVNCGAPAPRAALLPAPHTPRFAYPCGRTLYFFARIVRLTSVSWHSRSRRPCSAASAPPPAAAAR
jgi:hypothetical protein